jgi:mRNA-degrading endonuclease toxin of MazEF toxin-antitoxin module
MRRGEVRLGGPPVEGRERAGHRPVLLVSDDRYAIARKLAVVFPLTTNDRLALRYSKAMGAGQSPPSLHIARRTKHSVARRSHADRIQSTPFRARPLGRHEGRTPTGGPCF